MGHIEHRTLAESLRQVARCEPQSAPPLPNLVREISAEMCPYDCSFLRLCSAKGSRLWRHRLWQCQARAGINRGMCPAVPGASAWSSCEAAQGFVPNAAKLSCGSRRAARPRLRSAGSSSSRIAADGCQSDRIPGRPLPGLPLVTLLEFYRAIFAGLALQIHNYGPPLRCSPHSPCRCGAMRCLLVA